MRKLLTFVIFLFAFLNIDAQDVFFPRHAAIVFENMYNDTNAIYSLATYDNVWFGGIFSGGTNGYDYPDLPGFGDHKNENYPLGINSHQQKIVFGAKLLNPEQKLLTHRNLSFIECIQFDFGKNSPQRWFVDNLSPKWFAYTLLSELKDSIFSNNPMDTVFHITKRDAKIMFRYRKKVPKDSIPENFDGFWRANKYRYYWDYICFKDNDAGSGRGEFEIMAIKNIDTLTGAITVARKIKNNEIVGRTIYGTPQSYSKGARVGYLSHSNRISGSPAFLMNHYANRDDSLYEKEMMADGYDWVGACAQYVEKFMMPTAYTGFNPKTGKDTTIYLVDGVKLDVGGEEWKPYNFDRDGWPYYALDLNWDKKIDWVGISVDSLLESSNWDTLNSWIVQQNKLYAKLVYGTAHENNRDFYMVTNGQLVNFPSYYNGRTYEDFNGGFQDSYEDAIERYLEMNKPGNLVDPIIIPVFERDRDSSKVGLINFKDHRHIMALTTVLGNGSYGHCGEYSTHNKLLTSWATHLGQLNPEDWFDELAVDSLGRSSKYLYPEGNAQHRFENRHWLGKAKSDAIKLDSMYKPSQQQYAYTFIRYFKNGAAIYSQYHHKVKITGNYRKILGVDPGNDGSEIQDSIEILGKDGLFLFKIKDTRIAKFRKRPYMIFPGKDDRLKLIWQLDTFANCSLSWGTDTTYQSGTIAINNHLEDFQYTYDFDNLGKSTKYYYKVEIPDGETKTGSFYTKINDDATNFGFLVFGDTRTNQIAQNKIFGRMSELITNDENYQTFAISTGDFVTDGKDESNWDNEFFNDSYPYIQYILGNLPIQSVMGNHENTGKLFKEYFPYDFEKGAYYTFDYGSAIFIFLDQYLNNSGFQKEMTWLENVLKNTDKKWKFIILHEPGYSPGKSHNDNQKVQNFIQPLCKKYGVQIVFGGHNHYYARAEVDSIVHITTGGGGAPLDNFDSAYPYLLKAAEEHHYCKISIDDDELSFVAIDDNNNQIDQFTITLSATSSIGENIHYNTPEITVAPNPFANTIRFIQKSSDSKAKEIEIYNICGKLVKRMAIESNNIATWNGKDQSGNEVQEGIYIYRILYDKNVKTGKIIKIGN